MKIAYISTDFGVPILGYKGASIHVREMTTALAALGHSVRIISPAIDGGKGSAAPVEIGEAMRSVELFPLPAPERHCVADKELQGLDRFMGKKFRVRHEVRNILYNHFLMKQVLEDVGVWGADIVYERYALFGYAGLQIARQLGVPHLLEVNAPLAYEQEKMRGMEMKNLARETERRIFQETDQVLPVSEHLRSFIAAGGVPQSRLSVIPNAVDPRHFDPGAANGGAVRQKKELYEKTVIGFVGTLKAWHGTETLCEAFRRLNKSHRSMQLLIVGDGPERESLETFCVENDFRDSVTFTGNVPYDKIPNYIAAMDVAVAPYTPNENFYYSPIKIFEYMAMAKPVVAGRIGQVEEIIAEGETGLLFEPGNIDELQAALTRLVVEPGLRQRLGTNSRGWIEKDRTWTNNAKLVTEIAGRLLTQKLQK